MNTDNILNNLTQFQFPSLHQYIPGIVTNLRLNALSNESSATTTVRLQQQQFQQSQHIYYYPSQDAIARASTRFNTLNFDSIVGIPLKRKEKVLYATKPPIQFFKNILIMFATGFIVATSLFCIPMWWVMRSGTEDFGDLASGSDVSASFWRILLLYTLAFGYLIVLVYLLFYRLLYRKLNTVYVITNKRAIVIEGVHKFEQLLLFIKNRLSRLHPSLRFLISRSLHSSDGYSKLSMRDRYQSQVVNLDSDDTEDTDTDLDKSSENSEIQIDVVTQDEEDDNDDEIEKEDMAGYVTSWKFSEMGDLFFTLYHGMSRGEDHTNGSTDSNRTSRVSDVSMGGVYFGYKIESYTLPFTIVTHALSTGFILVPDVYAVLDLLVEQMKNSGSPRALPQARLIRSRKDPAIRSYVISRRYAFCGLPICYCCPDDDNRRTRSSAVQGKITEEDYRNLTTSYSLL